MKQQHSVEDMRYIATLKKGKCTIEIYVDTREYTEEENKRSIREYIKAVVN